MADMKILGTDKAAIRLMPDNTARQAFLEERQDAALVAEWLPLRANLTVIENIALVPQFHQNVPYRRATEIGWALLELAGYAEAGTKRDPDLTRQERFVTKLARAILQSPPIIVVDRPALQLPDIRYPLFLDDLLAALAGEYARCCIVDYEWNEHLYARPNSDTSV